VQFAQILLSDEQALMTRLALDLILNDPERYQMTDEERADYERLAVFFGTVAAEPSRFAPTGERARTVKSIVRRAKGPAQPASRRKPRSQGQQKRDRAARREAVEMFNAAREAYLKDQQDLEEYMREQQERYESARKWDIYNDAGQLVLAGVPEYALRLPSGETAEELAEAPKIVLPGNVEKQMERDAGNVAAAAAAGV
jgi:hypothetical protein